MEPMRFLFRSHRISLEKKIKIQFMYFTSGTNFSFTVGSSRFTRNTYFLSRKFTFSFFFFIFCYVCWDINDTIRPHSWSLFHRLRSLISRWIPYVSQSGVGGVLDRYFLLIALFSWNQIKYNIIFSDRSYAVY